MNPKKAGGWARHAFSIAFHLLRQPDMNFKSAIQETLLLGGDTDTNACIVGGMIGAWEGKNKLPEDAIQKLLTCNIKNGSKSNRPLSI
jgi:ADP-ribosyl-[dinitrogen reductase] hydrolase